MSHAEEINVSIDADAADLAIQLERNFRLIRDILTPEDWHEVGAIDEPPFENSWVNYGAGEQTAGFYVHLGRVHLKGVVKDGTYNAAIFTLPEGYRPAEHIDLPIMAEKGTEKFAICQILSDGEVWVHPSSGSPTSFFLSNIHFRTEQH